MYLKRSWEGFLTLTRYIDDVLMTFNNKEMIDATKGWFSFQFDMKDMSNACNMLGVKILQNRPNFGTLARDVRMKNLGAPQDA